MALVGEVESGYEVTYTVTLTPVDGDFNRNPIDDYYGDEPFTPLKFSLTASANMSGLSVSSLPASIETAVADNAVTVRAVEPVVSTIEVVGSVDGAEGDPFGFDFAAAGVHGCSTELKPWESDQSDSAEARSTLLPSEEPPEARPGTWNLIPGSAGSLCPSGTIIVPVEDVPDKGAPDTDVTPKAPTPPRAVETGR